jgi:hypothetical protein
MAVQDGGYKKGGFWRIDDRTGFKVRGYNTVKEWTGSIVDKNDFEARHPQDFVRGVADKQVVPAPRPRAPVDTYIGPLDTELTAAGKAGDITLTILSSVRMVIGDRISVLLDEGYANAGNLITTISGISGPNSITLAVPLPGPASIGNVVTDWSAVAAANIG